jgi:hypothetical protein
LDEQSGRERKSRKEHIDYGTYLKVNTPEPAASAHDLTIMRGWSNKDERMYEHIKESSEKRGKSEATAEEIAARTVNKERRLEGRTPNKRTEGTGNPTRPRSEHTRDEVYNEAKELKIPGRSKMKKDELIKAVQRKKSS